MFEPAPASTPPHETMGLTAVGQRKKHRTVRPLRAWVCILRRVKKKKPHNLFNLRECHLPFVSTDDLCPWSPWSPCSQTCGAGSVSRHRACVCEQGGDAACPPEIEAERNSVETQLCYKQPCPGTRTPTWQHCAACTEARHSNSHDQCLCCAFVFEQLTALFVSSEKPL